MALAAQDAAKPASRTSDDYASRWDIFAGYSYLAPHGTVQVPQPDGTTAPYSYNAVNVGGLFSGAYYFSKYVGLQGEFGIHQWGDQSSNGSNIGTHGNDDGFTTVSGGIIFRYPTGNITPFIHGLVGGARVGGPDFNAPKWGPELTAGGGMDYETPWLNHRLAIRIFQADYNYMHADFGPVVYGGRANINAARLSAGVVFHVGSIAPPVPPTIACSANPSSVFPGEPVALTATANGLAPNTASPPTNTLASRKSSDEIPVSPSWEFSADVERTLLVQILARPSETASHQRQVRGARSRRKRRRHGYWRRKGGGVQN